MRGLTFRRHQLSRAKARAVRRLRDLGLDRLQPITGKIVGRWAVDRTPCSCFLCGNPRHYTGDVTRQEILAACRTD